MSTNGAFQQGNINAHASLHEEGGADELSILDLGGYPADSAKVLLGDGSWGNIPDSSTIKTSATVATGKSVTQGTGVFLDDSGNACQGAYGYKHVLASKIKAFGAGSFSIGDALKLTDTTFIIYQGTSTSYYFVCSYDANGTITEGAAQNGSHTVYQNVPRNWARLSDTSFVYMYSNGGYPAFKVCTVSGTTITFGSGSNCYSSYGSSIDDTSFCVLDSTHFAVTWTYGGVIICRIASISGTTITWGTETYTSISGIAGSTKTLTIFVSSSSFINIHFTSSATRAVAATVSGTTPTFGSAVKIHNAYTTAVLFGTMLDSSHFFVATSNTVMAASISGTTITAGNSIAGYNTVSWTKVSATKIVCCSTTTIATFSISDSTVSADTPFLFNAAPINPAVNLAYMDGSNTIYNVNRISDTLISVYLHSNWYWSQVLVYQPVILIFDISTSTPALKSYTKINSPNNPDIETRAIALGGTDLVILNQKPYKYYVVFLNQGGYYFSGIAESSKTAGETVNIISSSAKSGIFSGLTPGLYYYLNVDGSLTSMGVEAGYPEINGRRFIAGQAYSSTGILNLLNTPDVYRTEGVQA